MPSTPVLPKNTKTMRNLGGSAIVLVFCFTSVASLGNLHFDMPACDNGTGNSTKDDVCRENNGPDMYACIGLWFFTSVIDSAWHCCTKTPFKCDKQGALTIAKCINLLMSLFVGSIAVGTQSWPVCREVPCQNPYFRISDFVAPLLANVVFYAASLALASSKSTTSKSGLETEEVQAGVAEALLKA